MNQTSKQKLFTYNEVQLHVQHWTTQIKIIPKEMNKLTGKSEKFTEQLL